MLDVERCSVWIFNAEGTILRCLDSYERSEKHHLQGFELEEDEHYFPTIKTQLIVVANEALTDPVTRGCSEHYLKPNGITSVLDVALVVGGESIGVLCCEHTGEPREWQTEDQTFAGSVASACSLVLESYQRAAAESASLQARDEAEQARQQADSARREAEAANLAKSEFLSRMSHELRTPLNAILGFGQILERQQLTTRQHESIDYILKGGSHLLGLINEVLDIARVEAGHTGLSLEPVALHEVLPEVWALVQPLAEARLIHIHDSISTVEHSYILADLQRFKQVLLNLFSNAIKYNRDAGQVEVSVVLDPGGWASIAVRDTGPGISPQDLPKLFTPFERLSAATSGVEGTGLGLVLAQRLVTAMGGTLEVTSILGQGTTFTIKLPQSPSPAEQVTNVPKDVHLVPSNNQNEHIYSVLCIEDNPSNLRLIEAILESRPEIHLLSAMQGSVGLDLARQHEPDLILLDLDLPDIKGNEVLIRLQKSAITKDIPVVIVSADATPGQIERLLAAGAKAYLTKPLDVSLFLDTVNHFLIDPQNPETH
jgi:signal transduction histidine kinase/CheY-like chemotaxis protein